MKVLFDVGHPAHVHYFRNLARILIENGSSVLFTAKPKEMTVDLLKHYGLEYKIIGRVRRGLVGKAAGLISCTLQLILTCLRFQPDILINASVSAALAARIIRKPHIALEDTFNMEQVRLYMPFTNVVLTGDYKHISLGRKEIMYPGYQELAYLHPNVFNPDDSVLESLGVKSGEKYAIVRFVAWNATHDMGQKGISQSDKLKLIRLISQFMRVFVTSETELSNELREYKMHIRPEQMHDALYYAQLFVGEGATMASEAALLGTPSLFLHSRSFGSIQDQASYGLLFHFPPTGLGISSAADKILEFVSEQNIKDRFALIRNQMLTKKIDVTAFLLWFVTNYPQSLQIVKKNPDYLSRFR